MPEKMEGFGQLVETARVNKEYSREKLSELVGVSEKHIYNIEHKGAMPSFSLLANLIYTLELPPEKVFYPNTEFTNPKLANVLKAVRRLNDSDLNVIKDVADSLLRNRKTDNS